MLMKGIATVLLLLVAAGMLAPHSVAQSVQDEPVRTIIGYVRDSGCVHRFHEVVKPVPNGCLEACVHGGSPLVVLTKDEHVFHPISAEMPDTDVRQKMLPFAGKLVKITGHVYHRGDSTAITLEQIEEVKE